MSPTSNEKKVKNPIRLDSFYLTNTLAFEVFGDKVFG